MEILIININDYSFRIMNKTKDSEDRIIVNIHSSESTNQNLLHDDNTIDEKVNRFSVYLSKSNLGCFRLLYKVSGKYYKGSEDYIQQTFIHLELNDYINKYITKLSDVNYDYSTINIPTIINIFKQNNVKFNDDFKQNLENNFDNIFNHINEDNRTIIKSPFIEYNKNICGKDYKEVDKDIIIDKLTIFSNKLTDLYNYSENNFVCEHTVNNELDNYKIQFYKINLNLKIPEDNLLDKIILYYCNVEIKKFNGKEINYYQTDRKNFKLPVFLTTNDKITKFGTFTNYILAGNYICKLFDYTIQCSSEDKKCKSIYQLIGNRYDDLFPFNIIKEPIKSPKSIKSQKPLVIPTRPVQLQINNSINLLSNLINNYFEIIQTRG